MKYTWFLFLSILIVSCQLQQPPVVDEKGDSESKYRTTPPSLLFFKNVRSGFYQSTEQSGTRITSYTLNRCDKLKQAMFIPYIASDWLNDQAYLMLSYESSLSLTALSTTEDSLSISWPKPDPINQTDWWMDIYQKLGSGKSMSIRDSTSHVMLDDEWTSCVKTTIKDYLRLTEQR